MVIKTTAQQILHSVLCANVYHLKCNNSPFRGRIFLINFEWEQYYLKNRKPTVPGCSIHPIGQTYPEDRKCSLTRTIPRNYGAIKYTDYSMLNTWSQLGIVLKIRKTNFFYLNSKNIFCTSQHLLSRKYPKYPQDRKEFHRNRHFPNS